MADTPPPDSAPPERKPWPMTWVAVAIATYIVIYTTVNVFFRKPGSAHEPAADAGQRQSEFVQAKINNWTRYAVHLAAGSPDETAFAPAEIDRAPAPADLATVVPLDLTLVFPGKPSMQEAPTSVSAPASVPADGVWRCRLQFDDARRRALGETLAYAKDHHLRVFLQDDRRRVFNEEPLPANGPVEIALPPQVLPVGEWRATLYTKDAIFTWSFAVPAEVAAPDPADSSAP